MVFPTEQLAVKTRLLINGSWVDVTAADDVLVRDPITITGGAGNEAARVAPTSLGLSLRNDGTYSDRNPLSPYYGMIGRNTQVQVSVGQRHVGAGNDQSLASTTSHVAPSLDAETSTGRLFCAWLANVVGNYTLPGGMTAGPAETDATFSTMRTAHEVVSASGATGTRTATFSAASGAASVSVVAHGVSVAVEESLSDDATPLGADATVELQTAATTEAGWWLFAVHAWDFETARPMPGLGGDEDGWMLLADSGPVVLGLQVRAWARRVKQPGAQRVAFPSDVPDSACDNHAALYVLSGVDFFSVRATVEIASMPNRWDVSGVDVWAKVDAAGILRRLEQGKTPLRSPLYREITGAGNRPYMIGYWPCEDGARTTQLAAASPDTQPATVTGAVTFASSSAVPGSAPLPVMASTGKIVATVPEYVGTDGFFCRAVYSVPAAGIGDGQGLMHVQCTGTIRTIKVRYGTGGSLNLQAFDASDVLIDETGPVAFNVNGEAFLLTCEVEQSGSGVDVLLFARFIAADGTATDTGIVTDTFASTDIDKARRIIVGQNETLTDVAVGHLAIGTAQAFAFGMESAITGWIGETAARRMMRLAADEDVTLYVVGDPDDTEALGPQGTQTLLDLLRDAEAADGGILYEPREMLGLAYRTRTSLYNQTAGLALTYGAAGEVAPPLEPEPDDLNVRNDVTVTRRDGSSARRTLDTGRLSVQAPPAGVGRVDEQVTLNLRGDGQVDGHAAWRLHLGTWDEERYPGVHVDLAALGVEGKASLLEDAAALGVGDKLTIADLPAWQPGTAELLAGGWTETLAPYRWNLRFNCGPAGPWTVGAYAAEGETPAEDEPQRYSPTDSQVQAEFDAGTDTALSVQDMTGGGNTWSTSAADFDVLVSGVRLRVTAVGAPSGAVQTLTVDATPVNGMVKTIPVGSQVELWRPARYAL